ncbi:uncharacterized protein C8A04DRAFT_13202 [Dichotomopilus funicola]|uniref:Rhodopsin domain-containing protein n=1 Tax=Dichotomopilus funicola TaxID=1934379 RepID=A0AAN6V088_9PEZI|nr:hypothetical protein C8A04DRAFT_13202 [Dichotomopilus funicola]
MITGPPVPPDPSTLPPEYVNASKADTIVGVVGAFHFLALALVALRLYARVFMVRAFGVDDGLIIAAAALALMSWICLVLQVPYGLGRHGYVVPVEDRIHFEHIGFWKAVFSDGFALGLLRVSVAVTLLRLNQEIKWYRWSLYAVIAFVVAYSIQGITWLFVYCTPYSGWWDFQWMNPFDPRCHDFGLFVDLTYWNIACNIFTDVVLGALPVPVIWRLRMKRRVRIYVIAILNLGYLAVLMGILKAVFMLITGGDPDQVYHYWVHLWENLQLNLGIIAACASCLRPLVGRILRLNSTSDNSHTHTHGHRHNPFGTATIGSNDRNGRRHRKQPSSSTAGAISHSEDHELSTFNDEPTTIDDDDDDYSNGNNNNNNSDGGGEVPSDANSEEVILQMEERFEGIMTRTDITVRYINPDGGGRN